MDHCFSPSKHQPTHLPAEILSLLRLQKLLKDFIGSCGDGAEDVTVGVAACSEEGDDANGNDATAVLSVLRQVLYRFAHGVGGFLARAFGCAVDEREEPDTTVHLADWSWV